jgi:hypothetical protein
MRLGLFYGLPPIPDLEKLPIHPNSRLV